jgi:hypothetical protein
LSTIRLVELAGGDIDEALKFVRARTSVETVRALLASRIDQAIAAKPHLKHLAKCRATGRQRLVGQGGRRP